MIIMMMMATTTTTRTRTTITITAVAAAAATTTTTATTTAITTGSKNIQGNVKLADEFCLVVHVTLDLFRCLFVLLACLFYNL